MALTEAQVKDVCFINGGHKQCRYVDGEYVEDDNGDVQFVFMCRKKSPPEKKVIDEEVADFLQKCKAKNQDPRKQGVSLSDNCIGYVALKTKAQGYDV